MPRLSLFNHSSLLAQDYSLEMTSFGAKQDKRHMWKFHSKGTIVKRKINAFQMIRSSFEVLIKSVPIMFFYIFISTDSIVNISNWQNGHNAFCDEKSSLIFSLFFLCILPASIVNIWRWQKTDFSFCIKKEEDKLSTRPWIWYTNFRNWKRQNRLHGIAILLYTFESEY